MRPFLCFFNNRRWSCEAKDLFDAKRQAVAFFKPSKRQEHMVHVYLSDVPASTLI